MAGTEPKHRDWIKLWVKESLLGTIREDLTSEERGMWYDFLLLAGNSRIPGIICANENTPLPIKRIAGILNVTEELVERSIQKFIQSERITRDNQGVIHIVNWSRYQYSDYDRQKPFREQAKHNARWEAKLEEVKQKFGEFLNVFLTPREYEKLKQRFGEAKAGELIEQLSAGIKSKGYKYKDHYATILNWARREQGGKNGESRRDTKANGIERLKASIGKPLV